MFIKKLTKIFKTKPESPQNNGLYATIEDLIAQRRYAHQTSLSHLHKLTSRQAGDVKSAFKGRGMEFEEIRAYTFGDDVRDIDWRVTARKQVPYTKLYNEEKDREVYVLLDLSPSMLFGTKHELKSVTAAKLTARIGWQSLKNKDRFGCLLYTGNQVTLLKAQNSQANTMLIFKKIADAGKNILKYQEYPINDNFKKAIHLLQQSIKNRAIIFIISDFYHFDEETQKLLAQLKQKTELTCIDVFDCLEKNPPSAGEYMVQQGQEQLVFSSQSQEFCKTYIDYFNQKHQKIETFCRQFKINYIPHCEKNCG